MTGGGRLLQVVTLLVVISKGRAALRSGHALTH